jgi:hypothetical protein
MPIRRFAVMPRGRSLAAVLIAAALLVTAACSHGDRNASARRPSTSNRLSSVVDGTPASALPLIASPTSTPAVASASAKLPPTVRVGGADILDASAGSRPAFIGQPADVNGRVTDLEGTGFWLGSQPTDTDGDGQPNFSPGNVNRRAWYARARLYQTNWYWYGLLHMLQPNPHGFPTS